jgi:hypothetical protein
MRKHINRGSYATTQPKPEQVGRCSRRCCWTPMGCARKQRCNCHVKERS